MRYVILGLCLLILGCSDRPALRNEVTSNGYEVQLVTQYDGCNIYNMSGLWFVKCQCGSHVTAQWEEQVGQTRTVKRVQTESE